MHRAVTVCRFPSASCAVAALVMLFPTAMEARAGVEQWRGRFDKAFAAANRNIHLYRDVTPIGAGVVAAVLHRTRTWRSWGRRRWWVHTGGVGDLRAYELGPGQSDPQQITRDQDIYKSNVGLHPSVTVQHAWRELQPGHLLLLCSDGLLPKALDHRALGRILSTRTDVESMGRALVAEARQRQREGRDSDNISVMLAQLPVSAGSPQIFALSDRGLARPDNQDAFGYSNSGLPQFLVLADGMSKDRPGGPYRTEGKWGAKTAVSAILGSLGAHPALMSK